MCASKWVAACLILAGLLACATTSPEAVGVDALQFEDWGGVSGLRPDGDQVWFDDEAGWAYFIVEGILLRSPLRDPVRDLEEFE